MLWSTVTDALEEEDMEEVGDMVKGDAETSGEKQVEDLTVVIEDSGETVRGDRFRIPSTCVSGEE